MPRISDLPLTSSVDEATAFVAVSANGTTYKISLANALVAATGASFFDSDLSHIITLAGGSNLSANRTLTLTTGDANRTLDISAGNTTISAFAITVLDDADAAAVRATLGLQIGVDVQAYDADLAAIAALTPTDNGVIIGNGASFVVESGSTLRTSLGIRERLAAARTYYVRTDGSDSNTGLVDNAGGAFLTIQAAVNAAFALDFNGYAVTIQVRSGTYTGQVSINDLPPGCSAANPLIIQGDTSTPSNVVISTTSQHAIVLSSGTEVYIQGFKIQTTTSGIGIQVSSHARVVLAAMDFGACATYHTEVKDGANAFFTGNYTISGSAIAHQHCTSNGYILYTGGTITLTGTPAFSAYFVGVNNAYVQYGATTFTGSATGRRHYVHNNASVYTDGSYDANFFPGSIAGILAGASCIDDYDGSIVLANTGLQIDDTDASHQLSVVPGSNLTADRVLTIITGDADRTLDLSAASLTVSAYIATLLDDADAATARTTLGLGTAATQNTGTSGATIPFLNGANTWSASQIISSSGGNELRVDSTTAGVTNINARLIEDGATAGPYIVTYRVSASPAASDQIGAFNFRGNNSAIAGTNYATLQSMIIDPTAASEDGRFDFQTIVAGALATRAFVAGGFVVGSPTGGDTGANTLNATTIYENGTLLTAKYGRLANSNTWTATQTITTTGSFETTLSLEATNADALAGPILNLYRNSASPAAADVAGMVQWRGNNGVGTNKIMGQMRCDWRDVTSGSEDTNFLITASVAGTNTSAMEVSNGVIVGSPTGFWQGTGTLNAVTLYENGTALTAKYGQLAVANTWTAGQTISGTGSFFTAATFTSTNADANAGPYIIIKRQGGSPAAADQLGVITFQGEDSALNVDNIANINILANDVTSTSEDYAMRFSVMIAGALGTRAFLGAGLVVGSPTGGDTGGGTINASTYYQNGTTFSSVYGVLAGANSWSNTNSFSATCTFTTSSSFGIPGQFISTNADANAGPYLYLYRNSASALASDLGPTVSLRMNDSAGTAINTSEFYATVTSVTPGAVTARLVFTTINAGATSAKLTLANGVFIGSASGGDMGGNTFNVNTLYEAGVALTAIYGRLGSTNTWTTNNYFGSGTTTGATVDMFNDVDFSAPLGLASAQASANPGPNFLFRRVSPSVAANDIAGQFLWQAYDNVNTIQSYGGLRMKLTDIVTATLTGRMEFANYYNGAYTMKHYWAGGYVAGSPTSGDMGTGTVNAVTLYENGTSLAAKYAALGTANTFTNPQRLPSYTVAGLPAGAAGDIAFTSNGRKNGEGAGLGTGVLVFHDGTAWSACDTGATVAA